MKHNSLFLFSLVFKAIR